ncbi:hypothetical protein ACFL2V_07535 [Pseudomonadota bacterium]
MLNLNMKPLNSYKRMCALLILCVSMLTGCTIGSPEESVAHKTVEAFYQAIQQNDIDKALQSCSEKRSPEQWRLHLDNVQKSLGKVDTFVLGVSEVNTVLSGRFYILEYQVTYSSGKGAKEILTLFDSVETDDVPLIVSHVISADGYKPIF